LDAAKALRRDRNRVPSWLRGRLEYRARGFHPTSVIDASLGPVRSLPPDDRGGREPVHELFRKTFPRFKEFEPQLRAAAQLALEQWALERAGLPR
jgi:hypothetical protein